MLSGHEKVIFTSILEKDDYVAERKHQLVNEFSTQQAFEDEYFVLFLITKDLPKISPTSAFIELYLKTNRAMISKSPYVDIIKYTLGDNDPYVEFCNSCIALFEEMSALHVTDEAFNLAVEMHKMSYVTSRSIEVLEESATILTTGIRLGNKHLTGYFDMRASMNTKLKDLDNIFNKSERKGLITFGRDNDDSEDDQLKLITTFGIGPLDEALGGMYEGDFVSLLAPAKGGKSRMATFIVHNSLVQNNVNCLMWSIENGVAGWKSLIRARHFNYIYNSKLTDVTQKKFIDADMIRKGVLEGEMKDLEAASWSDLKNNKEYGSITMIDEDFNVETFIDILDNALDVTGAKVICIDYLQLIASTDARKSGQKNGIISEAYIKLLQFLKRRKVVGLCPAQFKQNVVGDLSIKTKEEIMNMELRDSAGESYEIIKTPDVNLGLYASQEDLRDGFMQIISIPSRNSKPFTPIDLFADLGTCSFTPIVREE